MMDIQQIISAMTLEDKISLCTGGDFWHTKAMPQYGIPSIMMSDGPHGLRCQAEEADERHKLVIEKVEDEYFVHVEHDMTKEHYISFMAAVSGDQMQMIKLYPEGNAEARFNPRGVRQILFYCNQDGLFYVNRKNF